MKKTLLFILCCFALLALDAQKAKNCREFEDNFYYTGVDNSNVEEMLNCAELFYDRQFGSREDLIPTFRAVLLMREVIYDLIENTRIEASCDPGDPSFTGRGPCSTGLDGTGGETIPVNFRWPGENTGASGKFIDFSDGEIGEDERSQAGLSFAVKNCVDAKFFAMHSTCNNSGGSFYIIIVDKDLEFAHFPHGLPISTESNKRKIFSSVETTSPISIYPNPLSTDNLHINLTLTATTNITAQLYSSTNQYVRNLSTEKTLEVGSHHLNVELNNLPKGVYYLVVDMNGKRQVEKIVKI